MSHNVKDYKGTTIGVIKGDTRSLDYSSRVAAVQVPHVEKPVFCKIVDPFWGRYNGHLNYRNRTNNLLGKKPKP